LIFITIQKTTKLTKCESVQLHPERIVYVNCHTYSGFASVHNGVANTKNIMTISAL